MLQELLMHSFKGGWKCHSRMNRVQSFLSRRISSSVGSVKSVPCKETKTREEDRGKRGKTRKRYNLRNIEIFGQKINSTKE